MCHNYGVCEYRKVKMTVDILDGYYPYEKYVLQKTTYTLWRNSVSYWRPRLSVAVVWSISDQSLEGMPSLLPAVTVMTVLIENPIFVGRLIGNPIL